MLGVEFSGGVVCLYNTGVPPDGVKYDLKYVVVDKCAWSQLVASPSTAAL